MQTAEPLDLIPASVPQGPDLHYPPRERLGSLPTSLPWQPQPHSPQFQSSCVPRVLPAQAYPLCSSIGVVNYDSSNPRLGFFLRKYFSDAVPRVTASFTPHFSRGLSWEYLPRATVMSSPLPARTRLGAPWSWDQEPFRSIVGSTPGIPISTCERKCSSGRRRPAALGERSQRSRQTGSGRTRGVSSLVWLLTKS